MTEKLDDGTYVFDFTEDSRVLTSGGTMLRNAREASGMQLGVLASTLKVPVKKLETLEADRFDLLPDMVFVRALTTSVCRALKIDSSPILASLPHAIAPSLKTDEAGINTPFRSAGTGSLLSFVNQLSKPFLFSVLALLIGVVILIFLPQKLPNVVGDVHKSEKSNWTFPALLAASPSTTTENHVANEPIRSVQSASLLQASPVVIVASSPASTTSNLLIAGVDVNSSATGSLADAIVFKARDTSWVEVIDAKGTVQLRRTMAQGEVITVTGVMPLSAIVGRASNMDVQVRGQPFDLSQLAKDNVARFEVK